MKLISLNEFRENYFEGERPDIRTIRKWKCVIKLGGKCYIDLDVLQDILEDGNDPDELYSTNPLVQKVLEDYK